MKPKLVFVFISLMIGSLIYRCAPKAVKSRSADTYQEDLSNTRPTPITLPIDSTSISSAQTTVDRGPYAPPVSDITEELNTEIARLSEQQKNMPILVYTVQVYTGRSREEANQVRSQVYQILEEEEPELTYQQPNFKVRVGTYYDRANAYKTFKALKEKFPGAILVPMRIIPEIPDVDN